MPEVSDDHEVGDTVLVVSDDQEVRDTVPEVPDNAIISNRKSATNKPLYNMLAPGYIIDSGFRYGQYGNLPWPEVFEADNLPVFNEELETILSDPNTNDSFLEANGYWPKIYAVWRECLFKYFA